MGSSLVYSTYLGGKNGDTGNDVAVDDSGNAYVTGPTGSADFPTTPAALQPLNVLITVHEMCMNQCGHEPFKPN